MKLLYVELSPSLKRKDIFERIESVYRSLQYKGTEIGILTIMSSNYILKILRDDSFEEHVSKSIEELVRVFLKNCGKVYVLRENADASKPVEPCYVSGVYSDPPDDFENILESLRYSPIRLSLGSIPYLASSLIPVLNHLNELEHIFNTFMK